MGGAFRIYGDSIQATFTALEAPHRLALDWRFKSWPDSAMSKVKLRPHGSASDMSMTVT